VNLLATIGIGIVPMVVAFTESRLTRIGVVVDDVVVIFPRQSRNCRPI